VRILTDTTSQLRLAMDLSLELMDQGSCQVEMSDEGLMTDDIEECLSVVTKALKQSDLPRNEKLAWCKEILHRDRVDSSTRRNSSRCNATSRRHGRNRSPFVSRQRTPRPLDSAYATNRTKILHAHRKDTAHRGFLRILQ